MWMKSLLFCSLIVFTTLTSRGQVQPLLVDSFQTTAKFVDLSLLTAWGINQAPVTAFQREWKADKAGTGFWALCPSDSAMKYGSSFTNANSLKTCTAIDYVLPDLSRDFDTLTLTFDAYWDTLITVGEGGRIVAAFLHQYPEQPFSFGLPDSVNLSAPFGRPAYNVRILNRAPNAGGTQTAPGYLFYGGGMHPLGEFEKTANWWLPGFIAQPGGTSPQTGPAYPVGATVRIQPLLASSNNWRRFTLRLAPEMLEMWFQDIGEPNQPKILATQMAIPKVEPGIPYALSNLNQFYGTNLSQLPLHYYWAPKIEAIRFYFRSVQKAYLSNVRIEYSGQILAGRHKIDGQDLVKVFPNPNSGGFFQIDSDDWNEFQVFDCLGRKVDSGFVISRRFQTKVPSAGLYFLTLSHSTFTKTHGPIRVSITP